MKIKQTKTALQKKETVCSMLHQALALAKDNTVEGICGVYPPLAKTLMVENWEFINKKIERAIILMK